MDLLPRVTLNEQELTKNVHLVLSTQSHIEEMCGWACTHKYTL